MRTVELASLPRKYEAMKIFYCSYCDQEMPHRWVLKGEGRKGDWRWVCVHASNR